MKFSLAWNVWIGQRRHVSPRPVKRRASVLGLSFVLAVASLPTACAEATGPPSPSRELPLPAGLEGLFTSGQALVGTAAKHKLYIWDWQNLATAPKAYGAGEGLQATWSERGQIIEPASETVGANEVHRLQVRDPRTGEATEVAKLGAEWYVQRLASSQNGRHHACLLAFDSVIGDVIVTLGEQTRYALGAVNAAKRETAWVRPIIHQNREGGLTLSALAVSEDGQYVGVAGCDGSGGWVHMAVPHKGKSSWERVPDGSNAFGALAFAPDGKTVYAAGTEGFVYAFETATGRILERWGIREGRETRYGERITSLAASPDGRLLAAGLGPTGDVHLWDVSTGNVVLSLATRQATMYRLAFSPDSKFLATNGVRGRTVQVWQLPSQAAAARPEVTAFDAIQSGDAAQLDGMLKKEPKLPAARDGYGRTPLHWATMMGREDCARRVIQAGADLNARDFSGWTPLHYWASGEGNRDVGLMLLENGADLKAKAKGPKQWTPLQMAAVTGQAEVVEKLLVKGADVHASDGYNRTPLHLAAGYGHAEVVKVLLKHKAELTAKTRYGGDMAIHLAAEQGFGDVISVLLAGGAKVDAVNEYGQTPLILAAETNQPKVAGVLLKKGASVRALTAHGMPLHIAARDGSRDLVKLLLEHGADVNARDRNGWTPLRWARDALSDTRSARLQDRKDVEAILREHGAKE